MNTPDTAAMKTYERPTQFVVSGVPEDLCTDYYAWNVDVDWRGPGDLWAVKHFSQCLGSNGRWDYEPIPSSSTDAWKKKHRFPLAEALRLAHEAAPSITVNGITPADLIAKYERPAGDTVTDMDATSAPRITVSPSVCFLDGCTVISTKTIRGIPLCDEHAAEAQKLMLKTIFGVGPNEMFEPRAGS